MVEIDNQLYRKINSEGFKSYDLLMRSGLYEALSGDLVRHECEDDSSEWRSLAFYRVIKPEIIPVISYPYEWCFGQLRDAALLTLRIQRFAVERGMTLKDARAYNVQFLRGKPIFIDTLSFEEYLPGRPWVAYGQFCRHFLALLALASYLDQRILKLFEVHLDGIPLDLAVRLLPMRSKLDPLLAIHLHAHARFERAGEFYQGKRFQTESVMSKEAMLGLIDSLESAVRRLRPGTADSSWLSYYAVERKSTYLLGKMSFLVQSLEKIGLDVKTALDVGCNVGDMSFLLAHRGIRTISVDSDPLCVDAMYSAAKAVGERNVLPLEADLTNPSPAIGWDNLERQSLTDRVKSDLVVAMAIVHHLAVGNNVPLPMVAGFLASLCSKWLVVEFVSENDEQVIKLMDGRGRSFDDYHKAGFEAAFSAYFEIEFSAYCNPTRRMYLMRRKQ